MIYKNVWDREVRRALLFPFFISSWKTCPRRGVLWFFTRKRGASSSTRKTQRDLISYAHGAACFLFLQDIFCIEFEENILSRRHQRQANLPVCACLKGDFQSLCVCRCIHLYNIRIARSSEVGTHEQTDPSNLRTIHLAAPVFLEPRTASSKLSLNAE